MLLYMLLCTLLGWSSATELQLNLLGNAYPLAQCNDGTKSGYYFRPSPTGSSVWVVHQAGGGWCWDAASCATRSGNLISSSGWSQSINVDGLFNSTDARLANANLVYIAYCTSDGYIGNVSGPEVPFNFVFRGHAVVDAVFTDLTVSKGMGSLPNCVLLYSGCSAGARGALFNTAFIAQRAAELKMTFGVLLDSAFWVTMTPMEPNIVPFVTQVQAVYNLVGAASTLDPHCVQIDFPTAPWKCLMGEYAVPTLQHPYFLHAFQYDEFQISTDEGVSVPSTPSQLAYAEVFRNVTRAAAQADTIGPAAKGTAAMLPACYKHCNTEASTFSTLLTDGFSLESAVVSWFFGLQNEASGKVTVASVPQFIVDDCEGFNCGTDCPAVETEENSFSFFSRR